MAHRISAEEVAGITKGARQGLAKAGIKAPKNLGQAVRSALTEAGVTIGNPRKTRKRKKSRRSTRR